jgi:hypothetical protein
MNKQFIISEIQRTAENGKAIGQVRFTSETGIKAHEWRGKYWARWGDALIEAGFAQNERNPVHEEVRVFESLLRVAHSLGKFPTKDEISLARNSDPSIPSEHSSLARKIDGIHRHAPVGRPLTAGHRDQTARGHFM